MSEEFRSENVASYCMHPCLYDPQSFIWQQVLTYCKTRDWFLESLELLRHENVDVLP